MDMEHQEVPTWLGSERGPPSEGLDIAGTATDSEAVRNAHIRRESNVTTENSTLVTPDGTDTAGCNKLKAFATPGRRISLRTYSRQYEEIKELEAMDKDFTPRRGR